MQLFHNNIIDKTLGGTIPPIPETQLEILQNWKEKIENGSLQKQTEVAIHAPFTQNDTLLAPFEFWQQVVAKLQNRFYCRFHGGIIWLLSAKVHPSTKLCLTSARQ